MMKNILSILATCLACVPLVAQPLKHKSPYTVSENRLAPTTAMATYRNLKTALADNSVKSENYTLLSGIWSVKYTTQGAKIDVKDLDRHAKIETWNKTSLPSSWQMEGQGTAVYSQEAYPFLNTAPKMGAQPKIEGGTTAIYARDFTIPFDYLDKMLYVTLGGASGKTTLYVNGKRVGFTTDSRTTAQFDVTKFVERGLNRIVLQIEQYSQASLVEDQAGWRFSGVNRDIYMLAQPKIRMRDYLVRTSLDPTYRNGLLETSLLLKSELLNPHTVTVFYDLYDRHGKVVNQTSREVEIGMRQEDTVRFTATIIDVDQWTAETPSLYTLVYRVKREGRFTEYIARKIGFRTVEIKGKDLLINGVREIFKGVNLEEFSPTKGSVLTRDFVRSELLKMKRVGINAVRTGGYPLPQFFYEMTDSLGFYVVSTANLDAAGWPMSTSRGGTLANDPNWKSVFVDRVVSAYEQGKNSPSIVAWSLGENAGNGYNMYHAYNAIKERENTRPIIYSGAGAEWNTDIVCPLYPTPDQVQALNVQQPIIPSRVRFEPRYWTSAPNAQGAFIDRWIVSSITASGVRFEALSNDYKRTSVGSGNVEQTSAQGDMASIAELFAPVKVEKAAGGLLRIKNCMQTANLSYFKVRYTTKVQTDASKQKWVEIKDVTCSSGESVELKLPASAKWIEIGNIYSKSL